MCVARSGHLHDLVSYRNGSEGPEDFVSYCTVNIVAMNVLPRCLQVALLNVVPKIAAIVCAILCSHLSNVFEMRQGFELWK